MAKSILQKFQSQVKEEKKSQTVDVEEVQSESSSQSLSDGTSKENSSSKIATLRVREEPNIDNGLLQTVQEKPSRFDSVIS